MPCSHRGSTIVSRLWLAQVVVGSKCCSTSGHRDPEIQARSVAVSRLMHDDLHWLSVPQWVKYKLVVTVHRSLRHGATAESNCELCTISAGPEDILVRLTFKALAH